MSDFELKFDKGLFESCATYDCLTRCQYMDFDVEKARREIKRIINSEDSLVLHECATCYACEEYCKNGNPVLPDHGSSGEKGNSSSS